ncbi:MAG: hypothetical protein AAFU60_17355, partial [Bacteroidota bacterium]
TSGVRNDMFLFGPSLSELHDQIDQLLRDAHALDLIMPDGLEAKLKEKKQTEKKLALLINGYRLILMYLL